MASKKIELCHCGKKVKCEKEKGYTNVLVCRCKCGEEFAIWNRIVAKSAKKEYIKKLKATK